MQILANTYDFQVDVFEVKGSFDGIVRRVGGQTFGGTSSNTTASGRLIDVCVQKFTASGARSLTAHQSSSPIDTYFVFVRRRAAFLDDIQGVFQAFSWPLWGLLILILLFLVANLAFFDFTRYIWPGRRRVDCRTKKMSFRSFCLTLGTVARKGKGKIGRLCWNHAYNLSSLLFGQLPLRPSNDAPSRKMYILFKAFALGLAAFYTALLVNQFQAKEDDALFRLKKFCNGQNSEGRSLRDVHVAKGTSHQAFILNYLRRNEATCLNAGDDVAKRFDHSVPGGGANLCADPDACLKIVAEGEIYATLSTDVKPDWLLSHGLCNDLEVVGRTRSPSASTWILPLDDSYTVLAQSLSNAILLARDDGSFDGITETAVDKDACKIDNLRPVTVKNVAGFLILMAGLYIVAMLIFG